MVQRAVQAGIVPGAVALVRRHGQTVLHDAYGWAVLEPERRAMQIDTIFDLASLTKPLVTAPLVLRCADDGVISLDDRVCRYLPPLAHFAAGTVTIRQLLTHTGGLPAWSPIYACSKASTNAAHTIANLDSEYTPGSQVIYTCLGYILLGLLLEQVTGRALDDLARASLFEPLGLSDTGYGPETDAERCAWTERGNLYEQEMVALAGLSFSGWRDDCIPGTVHDGNAWYAMGGVSGNAGLFATAHDVGQFGQMWLDLGRTDGRRVLREQSVMAATADCTPGLDQARGLGWQINRSALREGAAESTEPSSAGDRLGPRAFGHTGFTGTSIWIDPDLDLVAVLLTNRVHPRVGDRALITGLRRRFHDAVVAALESEPDRTPA